MPRAVSLFLLVSFLFLWTPTACTPLLFGIHSLYKWVQKSNRVPGSGVQVVVLHWGSVIFLGWGSCCLVLEGKGSTLQSWQSLKQPEKEEARQTERQIQKGVHIYICTYIYVYMYMYM